MTKVRNTPKSSFVRESNKIEGIRASNGNPYFDSHMNALEVVLMKRLKVSEIHKLLSIGTNLESFGGIFRK